MIMDGTLPKKIDGLRAMFCLLQEPFSGSTLVFVGVVGGFVAYVPTKKCSPQKDSPNSVTVI